MSTAAGAADMPVKAPPPLAPAWDWSGFYLGGNIGYGVGHDPTLRTTGGLPFDTYELAPAGALGGGQIGYNSQVGKWVFGIEADWQWTHQTDTTCSDTCASSGGF